MDFPRMCPARWLSDQNFGVCMPPHDFLYPFYDMHSSYYRPCKWYNQSCSKEFGSTVENEKGNYKITLDVQQFRPNEISVKVADNEITVEGKHEERPDTHGFITRQFKRRYTLPSHCPPENVTSTLSSDGILTIIAEKKSSGAIEKIVPIRLCGAYSRKTQIETKRNSEMSQKTQKEIIKETNDDMNKTKSQTTLKEDHSRLLKPEFLKESLLETNGTCIEKAATKEAVDVIKTSDKADPLSIGSTSNRIEQSIEKSILGLTALTEQLGQCNLAPTSDACGIKSATEILGTKDTTEKVGTKGTSETCGMKRGSDICALKSTSEIIEKKSPLESGMKAMSKTVIEESSSSYKSSSSSMSSSTRVSGKTGECVRDIITAELREAAENV